MYTGYACEFIHVELVRESEIVLSVDILPSCSHAVGAMEQMYTRCACEIIHVGLVRESETVISVDILPSCSHAVEEYNSRLWNNACWRVVFNWSNVSVYTLLLVLVCL